jgi:hypothetical protein
MIVRLFMPPTISPNCRQLSTNYDPIVNVYEQLPAYYRVIQMFGKHVCIHMTAKYKYMLV